MIQEKEVQMKVEKSKFKEKNEALTDNNQNGKNKNSSKAIHTFSKNDSSSCPASGPMPTSRYIADITT